MQNKRWLDQFSDEEVAKIARAFSQHHVKELDIRKFWENKQKKRKR